jgi:hypothetical protein
MEKSDLVYEKLLTAEKCRVKNHTRGNGGTYDKNL